MVFLQHYLYFHRNIQYLLFKQSSRLYSVLSKKQNYRNVQFLTAITSKPNQKFYISSQNHALPARLGYNKFVQITRTYSTEHNETNSPKKPKHLPEMMPFAKIVWPSVVNTMKNWILVTFIIKPYFDREFSLPDFVAGTKHALQVVSSSVANGETNQLKDLVSAEALTEIQKSIATMSVAQRTELVINKEDIYFSFPYQIGIMFDETNDSIQKRWVEITMVFHVLRGLRGLQESGAPLPLNLGVMPEYRDKISICNYRFIKEFTQGSESDWTINVVNHFKPADYVEE